MLYIYLLGISFDESGLSPLVLCGQSVQGRPVVKMVQVVQVVSVTRELSGLGGLSGQSG